MIGGFFDKRYAKLPANKAAKEWRTKGEDLQDEAKKIKTHLEEADRAVTTILGELQTTETKLGSAESTYQRLTYDIGILNKEIQSQQQNLEQQEKIRAGLLLSQRTIDDTLQGLRQELGTELQSKLSDEEANELHKLNTEQSALQEVVLATAKNRTEAEVEKNRIAAEINNLLTKQRSEIVERLQNATVEDESVALTHLKHDTEKSEQAIQENKLKLQEIQESIEQSRGREKILKADIEKLRTEENRTTHQYEEQTKKMEKILDKRSAAIQKREENSRKIRELGSLPSDSANSLKDLTLRELVEQLREVNSQLKKYSSVNKKALDQYVSFSNQQQELGERKKELDRDEAIDRTFKGVAKNFREIFKELVPSGSASLVMMREESTGSSSQDTGSQGSKLIGYTGISIRASFSDTSENQIMQQLSGGQKALVSLSLIFAIQRADPAPFYLFDEMDSPLDENARGAVARLIKKLSENTQFIFSTFKPELVNIADKWYGIRFIDGVSSVMSITKDEALNSIASKGKAPEEREEDGDKDEGSEEEED